MSNANIFYSIVLFYTVLFVTIGFIGGTFEEVTIEEIEEEIIEEQAKFHWQQVLGFFSTFTSMIGNLLNYIIDSNIPMVSPIIEFLKNIGVGISILPIWLNTIIFTPLVLTMTYLIVDLVWIG